MRLGDHHGGSAVHRAGARNSSETEGRIGESVLCEGLAQKPYGRERRGQARQPQSLTPPTRRGIVKRLLGIDFIQFIWWWNLPSFKRWAYPRNYKEYEALKGKPLFYGLYLGVVEIRIFPVNS